MESILLATTLTAIIWWVYSEAKEAEKFKNDTNKFKQK